MFCVYSYLHLKKQENYFSYKHPLFSRYTSACMYRCIEICTSSPLSKQISELCKKNKRERQLIMYSSFSSRIFRARNPGIITDAFISRFQVQFFQFEDEDAVKELITISMLQISLRVALQSNSDGRRSRYF